MSIKAIQNSLNFETNAHAALQGTTIFVE